MSKATKSKSINKIDIIFSIYQIIEGMKYLHTKHIIHLDLKPENILIKKDVMIKIRDLGFQY